MKTSVLLFALFLVFGSSNCADPDFTQFPECNYTEDTSQGIPKFAPEFEIRTEVKWAGKAALYTVSFESVGYYSVDGSRGATLITRDGKQSRFLYDFKSGRAYNIYGSAPYFCSPPSDLYKSACSPFAYFVAEEAGFETVQKKCNMEVKKITYLENENTTVRAIPVKKWKQCLWMNDTSNGATNGSYWLMEYYFSANQSMQTAAPKAERQIPVRLNVTCLNPVPEDPKYAKLHQSRQLYDFFFYRSSIEDKSVFDPPAGVHCRDWSQVGCSLFGLSKRHRTFSPLSQAGNKTLPVLPNHFSLATITASTNDTNMFHTRLSFDQSRKMVLFLTDSNEQWIYPRRVSHHSDTLHTVVHDFNTGLSFDMSIGKCNQITKISDTAGDQRADHEHDHEVSMLQAQELFTSGNLSYTYVGKRKLNDADADVWIATRNVTKPYDEERMNVELYFFKATAANSDPAPTPGTEKYVPAAIVMYKFGHNYGQLVKRLTSTVNFYSEEAIFWKTFDVSECLLNESYVEQERPLFVVLTLIETKPGQANLLPHVIGFQNSFQAAIAKEMKVSMLRVSDIFLEPYMYNGTIRVWFTILPWPKNVVGNVFDAMAQGSVADAYRRLNATVDSGKSLQLQWVTWEDTLSFQRGSLRNVSASAFPAPGPLPIPDPPSSQTAHGGYGGGAMAALALAMLIIGGVGGVVGGFLLWKRNTGIAYQIYD